MTVLAELRYRVRPVCRLQWACWNDEYVVFEEASGQTHQLDPLHAFVLQLLSEEAQTSSAVLQAVSEPQFAPDVLHLKAQLKTIFTEFEAAGLLESVAP
ncbi:MAG: hypothetical protein COZ09_13990 [Comamonadaceae bacterium CG_4_10_14_3_um_filter_60_42]|nr:MAG: hypothetical protein AUK51_03235 [Comamonadaceae bacterium CG2_30_59_20]PIY27668.1 MAG: hypothetical protein COZ09_13990 [Comamonadaceae bacterium CG_4_10_14_3_um_filter_60_42]